MPDFPRVGNIVPASRMLKHFPPTCLRYPTFLPFYGGTPAKVDLESVPIKLCRYRGELGVRAGLLGS